MADFPAINYRRHWGKAEGAQSADDSYSNPRRETRDASPSLIPSLPVSLSPCVDLCWLPECLRHSLEKMAKKRCQSVWPKRRRRWLIYFSIESNKNEADEVGRETRREATGNKQEKRPCGTANHSSIHQCRFAARKGEQQKLLNNSPRQSQCLKSPLKDRAGPSRPCGPCRLPVRLFSLHSGWAKDRERGGDECSNNRDEKAAPRSGQQWKVRVDFRGKLSVERCNVAAGIQLTCGAGDRRKRATEKDLHSLSLSHTHTLTQYVCVCVCASCRSGLGAIIALGIP